MTRTDTTARGPRAGHLYHAHPGIDSDGRMRIDFEETDYRDVPADEVWAEPGEGAEAAVRRAGYEVIRWSSTNPVGAYMVVRYEGVPW